MTQHDDGGDGILGVCLVMAVALIIAITLGLWLPTIGQH